MESAFFKEPLSEIHFNPEQVKRQKSALDKKLTPLEIDRENETGKFRGSKKDYCTTLSNCQCVDFGRRRLPCKHMYRLAMEVGAFPGLEYTKTATSKELISSNDVVAKVLSAISSLSLDEQESFAYLCYRCGNNNEKGSWRIRKEFAMKLQNMNLVTIKKVLRVNADVVLNDWFAQDAHRVHRAFRKIHPAESDDEWWEH